jgi:GT2 family glycosyltransferase
MISIVMCSRDDARFESASASYRRALAGIEHEIVRIADATGMCEGYNRGIARARGERLLLSHDDVEILGDDFAANVAAQFERFDLFGVAGTTRLIGPAWHYAGPPWVYGQVAHFDHDGSPLVHLYSVPAPAVRGAQAVDGVLIGVRRAVWEKQPFDAATLSGFHCYDLDFSYRAHRAGFACGIACDLTILHRIGGHTGYLTGEWQSAAAAFYEKHKSTLPPRPAALTKWAPAWVKAHDTAEAAAVMRLIATTSPATPPAPELHRENG